MPLLAKAKLWGSPKCLDFTDEQAYIAAMKRAALLIITPLSTLLLTLLSLLTSTATAQTGWVRMPDGPWSKVSAIEFADDTHGYILQDATLYFTTDGGHSWRKDERFIGYARDCGRGGLNDISQVSIHGRFVSSKYFFIGQEYRKHCWLDEWKASFISVIDPADPAQPQMGSSYNKSRVFDTLHFVAEDSTLITGNMNGWSDYYGWDGPGLLLRSTDMGFTWEEIGPKDTVKYRRRLRAEFRNKDTGLVVAVLGNLKTEYLWTANGGKNWRVETPPWWVSSLEVYDQGVFYGNNGLWYRPDTLSNFESTSDIGRTWAPATVQPVKRNRRSASFYSDSSGYRVQTEGAYSTIQFTSDSKETWVTQTQVDSLSNVAAPSERVAYAVGSNGLLYKTTDGGGRFADVISKPVDDGGSIEARFVEGRLELKGLIPKIEVAVRDVLGRSLLQFCPHAAEEHVQLQSDIHGLILITQGSNSTRLMIAHP